MKPKGFTLLELLICISILAMILSILTGVFRLGFQTWKYSDKNLPECDLHRSLSHVMVSQVRSVYPTPKPAFQFSGKSNEMSFVTTHPLFHDGIGLFFVSYRIVEDKKDPGRFQLVVYEKLFNSSNIIPVAITVEEHIPLLKGIKQFQLAYLSPPAAGEQSKWGEEWNQRIPSPLPPDAIRIQIWLDRAGPPLELLIPVYCSGIVSRMVGGT